MGKSIKLYQDMGRRDILYPMRGSLAVALALTLWSCVPGYGGKYPLVEKYNWERKIDGQGENNPPPQKGTEPLIASRSGACQDDEPPPFCENTVRGTTDVCKGADFQKKCKKTCNKCPQTPATVTACQDVEPNCHQINHGLDNCADPFFMTNCQKTCKLCGSSACQDDLPPPFCENTLRDTPDVCKKSADFQNKCKKTCNKCPQTPATVTACQDDEPPPFCENTLRTTPT